MRAVGHRTFGWRSAKRLSASDTGNKQLKAKASSMQLKYSRARLAGGPTLIGRSLEGRTACPLSNANCEHDDHQAGESGSRGRVACAQGRKSNSVALYRSRITSCRQPSACYDNHNVATSLPTGRREDLPAGSLHLGTLGMFRATGECSENIATRKESVYKPSGWSKQ